MRIVARLGFVLLTLAGPARAADRPNILWISCEDTSPDLGCYGDTYARTPNLDRLAEQGQRFQRAFAVAPVCAPSRSCIITGMYPTTIGTHHMRSQGVPPSDVKCFTEYLRAAGYYCTNNVKTDYNFASPLTAWDESSNRAHWRNRAKGQPFFSVFNLTISHESQIRAPDAEFQQKTAMLSADERHDPAKAKLPSYYPDTPVVRRDWARYHDLVTVMDRQAGAILKQLEDDGLADSTIVFFFGDHGRGLPRAKRWVYDSGLRVPLIVRWPGTVAPGSVNQELVSFVDLAPTMLSLAGLPVPKVMQGQVFLGPGTAPPRSYIFGARDRMDETYDMIRAVRDKKFKYIRNFQPGKPYAQYIDYMDQMPTLKEWRRLNKENGLVGPQRNFFLPEKPVEELYDTDADPDEVVNLADNKKYQDAKIRLSLALDAWMTRTRDLGLIPEDVLKERMRPGGTMARTAPPSIHVEKEAIWISCPTPGASIAYRTDAMPKGRWKLFAGPVPLAELRGNTLTARACRLGYQDSLDSIVPVPR